MVMYLNLHMALEQMRQKAENSESEIGPRVSIKKKKCTMILNFNATDFSHITYV